jgi:ribose transport system substrate-binding protein
MKKSKLASIVLCLVLGTALLLTACSGNNAGAQTAAPAGESGTKPYKVYLITMDLMDQHWVSVDKGCKDAAAELGNIDYVWNAPTNGKDDAAQIECINNAVADGANLILLASNGPDTQVETLKEVTSQGVKIIYVDSPANFDALQTLATDNTAAGKTAGEQMIAELKAKGVANGKIGIVNVNAATTSTVLREKGFRAAFEGKGYEILETQYGEGQVDKSQQIATNYITEGCVGIFGTNEGGTVGVGNAIAEAGGKVVGVGFDKSDAVLQHIKNSNLLCTMAQNPYVMGYEGMKSAKVALDGGKIAQKSFDTGVSVIDKNTK